MYPLTVGGVSTRCNSQQVNGGARAKPLCHGRSKNAKSAKSTKVRGHLRRLAQDATPASPAGESLFADWGLPEITVTATDEGLQVEPSEVEAGRYLVTIANEGTSEEPVFAGFVQLPEGRTADDLSYADELAGGTPMPSMDMGPTPEQLEEVMWLFETYIAGGPSTINEVSDRAMINLPAGEYGIWDEDPFSVNPAPALTVTGEADAEIAGPEPEAAVTIVETGEGGAGYQFEVRGEFMAGPQIVEVLNASDQPHFVEAPQYPKEVTINQVMATFMFDPAAGATPSPDMLDFEQFTFAGWASTQSIDTTQWVAMDFAPGQTLLACYIPDPLAGGVPHAFEGMVQLVEVA